jgi:acetyl/propionyl-CoA carboxylase alpha subunit
MPVQPLVVVETGMRAVWRRTKQSARQSAAAFGNDGMHLIAKEPRHIEIQLW